MKDTIIPYFTAQVVDNNGKPALQFGNVRMLTQYLLRMMGKHVKVSISLKKKIRSDQENRYYWGVVVSMISEFTGMAPEEIHEGLKLKFLPSDKSITRRRAGQIVDVIRFPTVRSTASLGVSQFEEYLAEIRQWAQEFLNLTIPLPNEVDMSKV